MSTFQRRASSPGIAPPWLFERSTCGILADSVIVQAQGEIMQELTNLLLTATARIEAMYFQIQLDGGDPVYRERVYCYELYHQLRTLWPNNCGFCLNGELDKAAHPILQDLGADYAKPDLLIHRPGDMCANNTIIEVKSPNARNIGIAKDLRTLAIFRNKVGYQRAIYLLFGFEAGKAAEKVRRIAAKLGALPEIELWLHLAPLQQATRNGFV